MIWQSRVPPAAQPLTKRWRQSPNPPPTAPWAQGPVLPTLHFRVSLALIPLPTRTHIVPCLPCLLEEQLKLLAFVQPEKGKWKQQMWLGTAWESSGVVGMGSSACPGMRQGTGRTSRHRAAG